MDIAFYFICGCAVLIMTIYYLKRRKRTASVLFGSVSGILTLFLVNCFGASFGAELPLNIFNVSGSALLGVPFVAGLIILKYI